MDFKNKNMQKVKVHILLLSALMALSMTLFSAAPVYAAGLTDLNSESRHVLCTDLSEAAKAYYTGDASYENLAALSGATDASDSYTASQNNPLYDALQNLMQQTLDRSSLPVYEGYGEGSLAYYWSMTDTSPDLDNTKSSHFLMFYSDAKYEYPSTGTRLTMNREHIWPKSHASFHQQNGGSDLHHLRPSVSFVNDAKSDHPFGYVDEIYASGYDTQSIDGKEVSKSYPDKDVFEPKDDVKGDVARILLYVYCCWGQPNLYSDVPEPNLPAGDPDEVTNTGGRVIMDLDTLLNWMEDDPVDTWEMKRNDLAQQVQGNRNVFIDYPELAWQLFGKTVPKGLHTPTQQGCEHFFGDPVIDSNDCVKAGTRTETCKVCGNIHKIPYPPLGHIDEDSDNVCDRCDAELLGAFTLSDEVKDGDHLLLYHPSSGKAITPVVNSSSRLNGITAVEKDDVIVPDEGIAIFYAEAAEDGGFYLKYKGKYLSTPRSGGKLYWSETKDEYSVWEFKGDEEDCINVVNAKAGSAQRRYAIEYFNNAFTSYGLSDNEAFKLRAYTSSSHAWDVVSHIDPKCDEAGESQLICLSCGAENTRTIKAKGHKWDDGKITKKPTAASTGIKTYTCTVCGENRTETIDKLAPSDVKVSGTLLSKMKAKGKKSFVITWTKVSGADGYDIFFAKCNHKGKTPELRKVKTVKGNKTFKWTKKGLKNKTSYRAQVKAYVIRDGKKSYVKNSPIVHAYTSGGTKKYTNAKSVTVKKAKVSLKEGKTYKIKATVKKLQKGKKIMPAGHVAKLRYLSSNTKVATVSKSGKIKGVNSGTCYVYAYAHNGVFKRIKVTVKQQRRARYEA